jgi:hypothetical protein
MRAVFAQSLDEAVERGSLSLLLLCLSELRDLPVHAFHEHLRACHALRQETIMLYPGNPNRAFRFCTTILLITLAAQLVFVLLPFSLSYLVPESGISINGDFLPNAPQAIALPLWALASITLFISPIWMAVFGGWLALTLRKHWARFGTRQRILGGSTLLLFTGLVILFASPVGKLILYVFWD